MPLRKTDSARPRDPGCHCGAFPCECARFVTYESWNTYEPVPIGGFEKLVLAVVVGFALLGAWAVWRAVGLL